MNWVIACDPSAEKGHDTDAAFGWAIFCDGELISHGELTPDPETGFTRVRNWLRNRLKSVCVNDVSPKIIVATESAFLGFNPEIFAQLTRVKAHLESVALDACHSYTEISPLQSFQAATGLKQYPLNDKGKRSGTRKIAVQKSIKERYNLPDDTSSHECDACAIGLAVIQRGSK